MRLSELLKGIDILQSSMELTEEISGIFSDSRIVKSGGAFVAIHGENRDGNDYINEAFIKGASCIITDDYKSFTMNKKCILVSDSRKALAYMWNNYYGNPTSNMKIIAITGTNGKTSCAHYIYKILQTAGKKRGIISTIGCLINDASYEIGGGSEVTDISSAMTTPDPKILYSIFNEMRKSGVEYVVMEASSHALEQSKLSPLCFEVGAFTNLSPEHLDFHKNMEEYYNSKKKLFKNSKIAVINADDEYGKRLLSELSCKLVSFSTRSKADAYASDVKNSESGIRYELNMNNFDRIEIIGNICGEFSVYNTMLATLCALELGIEMGDIVSGIYDTKNISGRIEKVVNRDIFIDYAHTPYAMENVLTTLRKIAPKKRIIALFGCGGNRDKGKRAKMGEIASKLADMVIITSDNSRSESPIAIIRDILNGVGDNTSFVVIPNREAAIYFAIKEMRDNDLLVLLGKGHESYEIDKNGKHYFSEKEIIKRVLENDKV